MPRIASASGIRDRRPGALSLRLGLAAALVAVLSALGTSGAWALWAASDSAGSTAKAARIGVTQTVSTINGTALDGLVYDSTTQAGAQLVTITNTGSRDADYTLTVSATSASATLLADVSVEIGAAEGCSAASAPANAVTGNLDAPMGATGRLAPGASAVLCVRTSMTASAITANADADLTGTISAVVQMGTWSDSAPTSATFAQSVAVVAPTEAFFVNSAPRYNINNADTCVSAYGNGYGNKLARGGICDYNNLGQFRITNLGDGVFTISAARNATTQPEAPRWSVSSSTSDVVAAIAQDVDTQKWRVLQRADGEYRIESVAFPEYCVTVSDIDLWSNNPQLVLLACDSGNVLATQGFTFTMIGSPIPATPYAVECSDAAEGTSWNYLVLEWPFDEMYRQEISYRVLVNDVVITPSYLNSYNAEAQLYSGDLVGAGVKPGANMTLLVQYQLDGSAWAPIATSTFSYEGGAVACG